MAIRSTTSIRGEVVSRFHRVQVLTATPALVQTSLIDLPEDFAAASISVGVGILVIPDHMRIIAQSTSAKVRRDVFILMCENAHMNSKPTIPDVREKQRAWINQIRDRFGETYAGIARKSGMAPSTVVRFMNDETATHSLSAKTEAKIAAAFNVEPAAKTALEPISDFNRVPVIGYVQAGVFQHGFSQDYSSEYVSVSPDHRYPNLPRVAFRVRGDSMDLLYPEGTIVLAVRINDLARAPKTGEKVVVIRQTNGDQEATIKQIEIKEDGKVVLWPRSSNPEFSAAIVLPSMADLVEMPDNGCRPEYWIEGVIIQSIRPE
ncbi:LexA family transcriptional regulator [Gluconobacter sphaericus]|uniref:LexA family protein n=1 Tax=Gluconobacter sphaericus TaxID=574987 RepID=UPI001B8BFEFD|nr:LexA family transcriptional regulator [Gluconobacter sphaericus]